MPLPMQGDELLPGQQNIGGSGIWPGAPDRWRGDGALDSFEEFAETTLGQFGRERCNLLRSCGIGIVAGVLGEILGEMMGENVDQRAFELLRVDVAEFGRGEFLDVVVKKPRVVARRLQDQRFAARYCGTV